MKSLRKWFQKPDAPVISVADYNAADISPDIMGLDPVCSIPPPQDLYDTASYRTPFAFLWARKATTLQG